MKRWVVSLVLTKKLSTRTEIVHVLSDLTAVSEQEAVGKEVLKAEKNHPGYEILSICRLEIK
jgi:hypothetical protein